MLKKFKLPALALGTALAIMSPAAALASDHDRDHERHERHERREHVWSERGPGFRTYYGYGSSYAGGYYDRWGRWHSYGFYDRWGRWHPY